MYKGIKKLSSSYKFIYDPLLSDPNPSVENGWNMNMKMNIPYLCSSKVLDVYFLPLIMDTFPNHIRPTFVAGVCLD